MEHYRMVYVHYPSIIRRWNTFKTFDVMLEELDADIICFQEVKSSRSGLSRDVAIPEHFDSFFSFPLSKGGYSGVAVYTRSSQVIPLKAEEGISGKLQPKPPLTMEERVSPSYPSVFDIEALPDEEGNVPASFDALDSEGRGLVVDFGLFVLINVYCPNETSDARLSFKMNYHLMLQERVRKLIEEGREVIVLGDINICATPMDHCDGHLPSNVQTFWEHPARVWFRSWLAPNGPMIDVVRTFWPERKGLFTCWNTKISARETNYGTRVDYILVTRGLLAWIKHGDIQPSLKGSDHCPIYIDLHDEITLESGETLKLRDALKQGKGKAEPPRIAAKHWEEFSGKQTLLSTFFGKKGETKSEGSACLTLVSRSDSAESMPSPSSTPTSSQLQSSQQSNSSISKPVPRSAPSTKKRKSSDVASGNTPKKKKQPAGQTSLATFFNSKPNASSSKASSSRLSKRKSHSKEVIDLDCDEEDKESDSPQSALQGSSKDHDTLNQMDADYRLAMELAASQDSGNDPAPTSSQSSSQSKAAWSTLFTPMQPPKCTVHGEPAKKYTVNKQGPNKGRTFYLCSRPVGSGYDRGKNERLREEVDHRYRCNYFKWASDLKRESSNNKPVGNKPL